jgi:hypothetical protein
MLPVPVNKPLAGTAFPAASQIYGIATWVHRT